MNKYRITNPNNNIVRDCKSRTTDEAEYQFYYTNDHLGSSTYITNKEGQITQTLAYLPYGEDWIDLDNQPPYLTPYKFNGKEKDQETGYNNYGARYYYDWASIWLSVDPMSDKYPHLTSYNYCANNPIMLVDPDGRDVVLTGEDGSKYNYGKDPKYDGKDKFILQGIETLDKMNSTEAGGKVLSDLIGSEGIYNITNGSSKEGTGSFSRNMNGKGGTLNMNGKISLSTLSHELFHGYQHENGQGAKSVNNEVESYLFSNVVNFQYTGGYGASEYTGTNTNIGKKHSAAMDNLLYDGFSKQSYETAIQTFLDGNTKGNLYKESKYEIKPISKNPLIKNFLGVLK